jgi:hypothetical protein
MRGLGMKKEMVIYTDVDITTPILTVRGHKVILDSDLARIYGLATKAFNRAVKRNAERFPSDFLFQLTREEYESLRCQIGTSKSMRGGRRYLPFAFTEHGAIMATTIVNTPHAVQMSVFVVRAFIRMRQMLIEQRGLARKLAELEKELTARLDVHETAINEMFQQIKRLLSPPSEPEEPKKRIGFLVEEPRVRYKSSKQSKMEK